MSLQGVRVHDAREGGALQLPWLCGVRWNADGAAPAQALDLRAEQLNVTQTFEAYLTRFLQVCLALTQCSCATIGKRHVRWLLAPSQTCP